MNYQALSILQEDNIEKEEYIYHIGQDGQCPLALFLMLASDYNRPIARYFSLITHTKKANEWQAEVEKDQLHLAPDFILASNTFHTKGVDNITLDVYAQQFAKLVCMATPHYECGQESVYLECPQSYQKFWARAEFQKIQNSLHEAFDYLLAEVLRVCKSRGIMVDRHTMTIALKEYKAYHLVESYAW